MTRHSTDPESIATPRWAARHPRVAVMHRRIVEGVYAKADARGVDRRRFLESAAGFVATISVAHGLAACGAESGADSTLAGEPGGPFGGSAAGGGAGDSSAGTGSTATGTVGGGVPAPGTSAGTDLSGVAGGGALAPTMPVADCPDPATLFDPADHDPPAAPDFGVPGVMEASRATFTRMDTSNVFDWLNIGVATASRQAAVGQTLVELLNLMQGYHMGFGVDLLTHSLQAATRAKQANASDDMVLGALLHDVAMVLTPTSHALVAAAIVKSYVDGATYEIVKTHEIFRGRHVHAYLGRDPNLYLQWSGKPWFEQALTFADEYDGASFDPSFTPSPLAEFMPLITQRTSASTWYESQVCG